MARKFPTLVYISGHNLEEAEALASKIRGAEHIIVSTWHAAPDHAGHGAPDHESSDVNLRIIGMAVQVHVNIAGPEKYTGGKFVEQGFALAHPNITPVQYGRIENGMHNNARIRKAADWPALLAVLDGYHDKDGPEEGGYHDKASPDKDGPEEGG